MDTEMHQIKGAIYADDSSDEERGREQKALPQQEIVRESKSKYEQFVEDVKQRESLSRPKH